jgi:predicted ester cyclase
VLSTRRRLAVALLTFAAVAGIGMTVVEVNLNHSSEARAVTTAAPRSSLDGFHHTENAQRADELVRSFFTAVNKQDYAAFDTILARNFQSYAKDGVRSRTALKKYYQDQHASFSDLHFAVHENVGVLVDGDLVAFRTIMTGTHTGDYAGVAATGKAIQTSASHFFRIRGGQLVEHWQVVDTYRILAQIGRIPGVAGLVQQQLGVPPSPDGVFVEKPGTEFGATRTGRRGTTEESRAVGQRLYSGVIDTGNPADVDALAKDYIQNTGWTPNGREAFGKAWATSRAGMPGGKAVQTLTVAENDRVATISVWDGTMKATGVPVDFTSADFLRIEDGVAAEHWDTVDYVSLYKAFGLLPRDV